MVIIIEYSEVEEVSGVVYYESNPQKNQKIFA